MSKRLIAGIIVVVVATVTAEYFWARMENNRPHHPEVPAMPATYQNTGPSKPERTQTGPKQQQTQPAPTHKSQNKGEKPIADSPAARYCAADHDKADTKALTQAGGLIQIFQHDSELQNAYRCAEDYIKHGGRINQIDPRKKGESLTPLLYAIKRDDAKMVRFMLSHGANLEQRGGKNNLKPYGYAVAQGLRNRDKDYNAVIKLLNTAMERQNAY